MRQIHSTVLAAVCLVTVLGCFQGNDYSSASRLPESVNVVESFVDRSGMDSFFLLRARFSTEVDVELICREFNLSPCPPPKSSFAEIFANRNSLSWFPLTTPTQCYSYCSINEAGTQKKDASFESVDIVLWVDEKNRELILQEAGL